MPREKKPKLPIMEDTETLSLSKHAAIIDIAFGVMDDSGTGKRWLINPDSYQGDSRFVIDDETIAFHGKSGLYEQARAVGHSWQRVAAEVHEFLALYAGSYEVHLWTQGKDFDAPILEHLFKCADLKTPYKYSHVHCLRDLSDQYPEVKRQWYGDHTAMKDVIAQVNHLKTLAARFDRVYKFVYGE